MLCCLAGGCALKQSGWKDALVIVAKYTNACLEKMHFVPLACQVAAKCPLWLENMRFDYQIAVLLGLIMEDAEQRSVLL